MTSVIEIQETSKEVEEVTLKERSEGPSIVFGSDTHLDLLGDCKKHMDDVSEKLSLFINWTNKLTWSSQSSSADVLKAVSEFLSLSGGLIILLRKNYTELGKFLKECNSFEEEFNELVELIDEFEEACADLEFAYFKAPKSTKISKAAEIMKGIFK